MTEATSSLPCARERGIALVEVMLFIVLVGVAVAGLLSLFAGNASRTAQMLGERQALQAGEAILSELKAVRFSALPTLHNRVIGPGIRNIAGVPVTGFEAFTATITVTPFGPAGTWNGVPASQRLLISVNVAGRGLTQPALVQAVRIQHASSNL